MGTDIIDELFVDGLSQAAGTYGSGADFELAQLLGSGLLLVSSKAGNFDQDGDVDGADFLTWQRDPSIGSLADWESNYGAGAVVGAPLSAASTAVPEPATFVLLGIALVGLVCGLRDRSFGNAHTVILAALLTRSLTPPLSRTSWAQEKFPFSLHSLR